MLQAKPADTSHGGSGCHPLKKDQSRGCFEVLGVFQFEVLYGAEAFAI